MRLYKQNWNIVLASASPRRKELLDAIGLDFIVRPADCDESILPDEKPEAYVVRLAGEKAQIAANGARCAEGTWILGADTVVMLDGALFGKPADAAEAVRMLGDMQGREHRVLGAFAIVKPGEGVIHSELHISRVVIRPMSRGEIEAYVATGEPLDKAGAYAIQGIGGAFVSEIFGSFSNVIGLNTDAVIRAFKHYGVLA